MDRGAWQATVHRVATHFQRRKWKPIPAFLSGKSHGQRSLAGYSPQGCNSIGHDLATEQSKRVPFSPDSFQHLLFADFLMTAILTGVR